MSKQTFIILIIILVFGGAGLWFFYFPSSSTPAQESTTSPNPDIQRIKQELADLRRLKDLQLDTSILKNPFLQLLETPHTPPPSIGMATPGRANPFLPF